MKNQFPIVGIVGAGAMGRGIAQIAAQAGSRVLLLDMQPDAAASARGSIQAQWQRLQDKGRISDEQAQGWGNLLEPVATIADLAPCDLVIEAIVERLDVKQAVFAQLEAVVAPDAVLVSNTSSLSVTQIAAGLQRPARFAGLHFFNPVHMMPLVEVIRGEHTSEEAVATTVVLAQKMGKTPIVVNDCPGFLVNRVLFPYFGAFDLLLKEIGRAHV